MRKFSDLQGKGSKSGPARFKPRNGKNRIRVVGLVVPGYKYWLTSNDGASIPMDCLSFDRETESFDNTRRDPVREHFPDKKSSWAYCSYVIDYNEEEPSVKLFDHKKKLLEQVIEAAEHLGDPTDPDKGWDIIFTRKSTGPKVWNVEYSLSNFELKARALTAEEKEMVEAVPPLESVLTVATAEEQDKFIKERILATEEADEEDTKALGGDDL